MYQESISKLKSWTLSENRWMRRGAAVSLIIPARKGKFLDDILEIANALLTDTDDLVQKGYGWMLKAASQAHQQEIFHYVISKKNEMPRTALRYAIEKMPSEMRKEAMKRG
jgi:3-methyladenine DNA glycosylase AlkD